MTNTAQSTRMTNEENEVRLTLLEHNRYDNGSDGNNNVRPQSFPLELEETSDETILHCDDDPSAELLGSEVNLEQPKVIVLPSSAKNSPLSTQKNGIELVWRNLSFQVNKSSCIPLKKTKSRTLINNLNGCVQSGQLTAIIGPSGSGKTTLIECLAGRRIKGVTGEIMVNYTGFVELKMMFF